MTDTAARGLIQQRLLDWYRSGHRDLPWRNTRDPYRILVSEVMLQQTQAERVIPKYEEFLRRFPNLHALADAPASEVIRAWAGLGYNRRALNLHRACREVVERFNGAMPSSMVDLQSLPGIGPYTAGAVACFAFGADVAFIDTNIRRVLQRVVHGVEHPGGSAASPRQIQETALKLVPEGAGYEWNQALMELGATLCRARHVECGVCPLEDVCRARPVIESVLRELPRRRLPVSERFEHTSRFARGRIIAALLDAPASGLPIDAIGFAVRADYSSEHLDWLQTHLTGLIADGLVIVLSPSAHVHEDSPHYDGESRESMALEQRYALPS